MNCSECGRPSPKGLCPACWNRKATLVRVSRGHLKPAAPARRLPDWLSWLLVLPCALLALFVSNFAVALAAKDLPLPHWVQDSYWQLVSSSVAPWAFVFVGAQTAPPARALATAIALAIAYGSMTGTIVAISFLDPEVAGPPSGWLITNSCLNIVAVAVAAIQVARKDD